MNYAAALKIMPKQLCLDGSIDSMTTSGDTFDPIIQEVERQLDLLSVMGSLWYIINPTDNIVTGGVAVELLMQILKL